MTVSLTIALQLTSDRLKSNQGQGRKAGILIFDFIYGNNLGASIAHRTVRTDQR